LEWVAAGAGAAIGREISAGIPGWTGQGEVWSGSWRWWPDRPRVAASLAGPAIGLVSGTWRIDVAREVQSYRAPDGGTIREKQLSGGVSVENWLTPNLRYDIGAGLEAWDDRARTVSGRMTIDRRWLDDRLAASAAFQAHVPLGSTSSFRSMRLMVTLRTDTPRPPHRVVSMAHAGVEGVTGGAPRALWPGAGEGLARARLLRAHPLLNGGIIAGPAFGRSLAFATIETTRWLEGSLLAPIGIAVFGDAARVWRRDSPVGAAFQLDAGIGLRVRGSSRTFRIDFGWGLREGGHALTFGYTP
jgi:hypothetical protein